MPTIFLVVGGKGGVGATTIAVELAQRFSSSGETLFVDGDLSGRRSGAAFFNAFSKLEERRTSDGLAVAPIDSRLSLMEVAANIHSGFVIKSGNIEDFLSQHAHSLDTIVVDAPQPFAAAVRPFAVRATGFLLVVEPTVLGVTAARSMQLEMMKFGIPARRIVLAQSSRGKAEVKEAEIERALELKLAASIPPVGDRQFERALTRLNETIKALPPEEQLVLRPSSATPLGERRLGPRSPSAASEEGEATEKRVATEPAMHRNARDGIKADIHREVSRRIDFAAVSAADNLKADELRAEVEAAVAEVVAGRSDIGSAQDVAKLRVEIIQEALGLGPLEDLMADDEVSEIMVNGAGAIFVERGGRVERSQKTFSDERQLRLVIERIIAPLGRRIDEAVPMVDARLPDGSRVNATIGPLTIDGATLTIRRFGRRRLKVHDIIAHQSLTVGMADFLRACVEARLNVVISGGTGSGKTTLLNVLSQFVPNDERIITIEDAAELALEQENLVRMEARPANVEGRGEIRIRDLVKNALRMRPDRIVVGECRGGEALDMLQAMNTGHDGSLTTVHANTPRDCVSRIETMVLMAGFEIPVRAIREQIVAAVDIVVQVARLRDGSRKITSISEVSGMEGDVVTMQEILRYEQRGTDKEGMSRGEFTFTGVQPNCMKRFAEYGITFDLQRLNAMPVSIGF